MWEKQLFSLNSIGGTICDRSLRPGVRLGLKTFSNLQPSTTQLVDEKSKVQSSKEKVDDPAVFSIQQACGDRGGAGKTENQRSAHRLQIIPSCRDHGLEVIQTHFVMSRPINLNPVLVQVWDCREFGVFFPAVLSLNEGLKILIHLKHSSVTSAISGSELHSLRSTLA